ncbi:sugar-transfer associated ATP-grasp domain-containing protein [Alkalicoccus halolimnae]|uniref:Sugar-transfer associated ATP-grasp domain-containing protein n=1 Tax=Alkalicoccus halolimnae TaxID=1667239 RepID=A0A5C7F7H2_9BACI|nr:sugar-transfer associated ATP-grasp domain-containing protein [Alkalicoccus halolimnae]TXF85520.1 hypothetical protein FTX54_07970 [Alkalicoccus halolimnae]
MRKIEDFEEMGMDTDDPAFKRYYKAGLLEEADGKFLNHKVKSYWSPYLDDSVDTSIHAAFHSIAGYEEPKVVPQKVMWDIVMPFLNDMSMQPAYSDKNLYDILFQAERSPETYVKRIDYKYYDGKNKPLTGDEAEKIISGLEEAIVKPSNRDNGSGIQKIKIVDEIIQVNGEAIEFNDLEHQLGSNFIVQEVIQQHSVMSEPHPESVNTLRMVTLRWNNEIHYCLAFARFGTNGAVQDNAGTGGVCVGITDEGDFVTQAVDEHANVMEKHPTTDFDFKQTLSRIPNFDTYIEFVKRLHERVLHHHFVSWDIAVGENGEPIFLEANFRGATWLYQLASQKPVLGELTTEIFEEINRLKQAEEIDLLKVSPSAAASKKKIKGLRKRVQRLKKEAVQESLEKEALVGENQRLGKRVKRQRRKMKRVRREADEQLKWKENLVSSSYWKVTAPIRKVLLNNRGKEE